MQAALGETALYPEGAHALRMAISHKWHVAPEQIVLGNGSNDVLELAARTFMQAGDAAVFSQFAFAVYPLATQVTGATPIEVPARNFGNDLDAMLAAVHANPATRMVFLANPNNPTGTFVTGDALKRFIAALPSTVLVVLDEAYGEYLEAADAYDSTAWLSAFPNLLISRTLSKAYGLAGLRIGFGLAHPDVIALMNRVRQPFNVNFLAMVAAVAALADDEFIEESRRVNTAGLKQLKRAFDARGITTIPAYGNFISFEIGESMAVFKHLMHQGVIVRPLAGYGLATHLRVSVGTEAQNARFITALDAARAELKV
jgi:histidinol-phosphate aminotransferase